MPKRGRKAPGPDGKSLSTDGWEKWPEVDEDSVYGLVYIVSLNKFGYYDDDDEDDDGEPAAIVYLGMPLLSNNVVCAYDDLRQPPFDGNMRPTGSQPRKKARSASPFSSAPGPDGEDLSTDGWEDWPKVKKYDFGLVYVVSEDTFGYYDDSDFVRNPDAKKKAKKTTQSSKRTEDDEEASEDDDLIEVAVVYLGMPMVSDYINVAYDDMRQPPFEGNCRAL